MAAPHLPSAAVTDQQEPKSGVTAGVLDAERRARDDISRRRRLLIGGGVLGLVVALAVLAVMTVLQQRANQEAELAADRAEARAELAEAVVTRAEDYEAPATGLAEDATTLRATLGQLVTESETSDGELTERARTLLEQVGARAEVLTELTAREVPEPAELVDPDRAVEVLRELETLRAEAGALAEEAPAAATDVAAWLRAVAEVNAAVAAHVEQVESEPSTSDPAELVELWEAERPALERLATAAAVADDVEGLAAWSAAHEQYATSLLAWIDEAVTLLEDGDIDTYNERFDQLFDTDDPFGFGAAVAASTDQALASPALVALGTLEQRATIVLEAVARTEETVVEQLADDPTPSS